MLHAIKTLLVITALFSLALIVLLNRQSIRLDEAQTIWIATKSVSSILQLTAKDVHVPLYSLIMHAWISLFGTEIRAVRLVSVFFFLLTIPVLFTLAKSLLGNKGAVLTIILFITSPFILWYSSEARMYSLFVFITTLHHLLFLRVSDSPSTERKLAFFLVTVIGYYTHYFFLFVLFSQGVYLIIRSMLLPYFSSSHRTITSFIRYAKVSDFFSVSKVYSLSFLFFIPWIVYAISLGFASNTQPLIPPPSSYNLLQLFSEFFFGFQEKHLQSSIISLWPLGVVAVFIIFPKKGFLFMKHGGHVVLASFLPIIAVFLASFLRPIFLSRYLILVTPTFFIFLAWFLLTVSKKLLPITAFSLASLMLVSAYAQHFSLRTPVREDYQRVSQYLSLNAKPNDIIVISAPFTIYPIEYAYSGSASLETIPYWNRFLNNNIPQFSQEELENQILNYKDYYRKLFVVLSYDQGYEKNIRDLLDQNYGYDQHTVFSEGLEIREYILRYDLVSQ